MRQIVHLIAVGHSKVIFIPRLKMFIQLLERIVMKPQTSKLLCSYKWNHSEYLYSYKYLYTNSNQFSFILLLEQASNYF